MIISISKIKAILRCVPINYKNKIIPLFSYNLISISFDLISIAMLLPFLMLIFNPKLSAENQFINFILKPNSIYYSIIVLVLFFIIKNLIGIKITKYQSKLIYNISSEISKKYTLIFLSSGYLNYQKKDKGTIIKNTIDIPNSFVNYVLMSMITLVSELVVVFIISIIGFVFFRTFSIYIFTAILSLSICVYIYRKKKLSIVNQSLKKGYDTNVNFLLDIINGYLNIKSTSKEAHFLMRFNSSNQKLNSVYAYMTAMRISNSKLVETLIILIISFLAFYLSSFSKESTTKNLILVSYLASVSLKLIPSLNKIFIAFSNLKAYNYTIDNILNNTTFKKSNTNYKRSKFNNSLSLNNISFRYNNSNQLLKNIHLKINKGEIIGITGRTGSGKTTLIHIILKLLKPTSGKVFFDIDENEKTDWLNNFGYVPQQTHIYSGTILKNIAIGLGEDEIDINRINELINAFNFKEDLANFSKGIHTNTGNSGLLLSGGQKQKIALIRALYFNPKILILDEATNQLDKENETLILDYIKNLVLNKNLTLILISHNSDVLNYATRKYKLENMSLHEANI